MSFFRVLLALLIAGGIGYSLYIATDDERYNTAVEAVRSEIIDPLRAQFAPEGTGDDTAAPDMAPETAQTAEEAVQSFVERTQQSIDAAAEETGESVADAAQTLSDSTETMVESAGEAVENAADMTMEVASDTAEDAATTVENVVEDAANALPRIATQPAPADSVLPDEGAAPTALEPQASLPAVQIDPDAAAPETPSAAPASTDVLGVVSGGMAYAKARDTMIAAGWTPRIPDDRSDALDETETALIEAGFAELEGCNEAERPLCRFEFVDGEKRIAAVLTMGTSADPDVIDAFLMDIRAE